MFFKTLIMNVALYFSFIHIYSFKYARICLYLK